MSQKTIYVHILAHLPHYYPLYMAAKELSSGHGQKVFLRFQKGVDSLRLFDLAAIEYRERPDAIHLVVSGEHEHVYGDESENRTIVDDFVCASLLLARTPLWIKTTKAKEEKALALLTNPAASRDKLHLPKARTTLSGEILNEFEKLKGLKTKSGEWNTERVEETGFAYLDDEKLEAKLEKDASVAYFSIFPPRPSRTILCLNDRPPSTSYGFSGLWLLKIQSTNRSNLESLVRFMATVEFFVEELTDCDEDILDSGIKQIAKIAELLKDYPPATLHASIFDGDAPQDSAIAWHDEAGWMLQEFNRHRIWAYNHALQFRSATTTDDSDKSRTDRLRNYLAGCKLAEFNPRCLTEHLLRTQEEVFSSRIKAHLDTLIKESEALDNVSNAVKSLMVLTTGSSSAPEEQAETALSALSIHYIKAVFSDPQYHKPSTFAENYPNEGSLEMCFTKFLHRANSSDLEMHLMTLDTLLQSRLTWLGDSGLFGSRFRLLVKFLREGLEGKWAELQSTLDSDVKIGSIPILIFELKALSYGWIPGSWVLGLGNFNKDSCLTSDLFASTGAVREASHPAPFPALRRDVVTEHGKTIPSTFLGSIVALAEIRSDLNPHPEDSVKSQNAIYVGNQLVVELELSKNVAGSISELIPLVFQEKPRQKIGQTSTRLRRLLGIGWAVLFTDIKDKKLQLIYPKDGLAWV